MSDSYTLVNYDDVEPVANRLRFLREPLDCANLGMSVRELEPGEVGQEHDHAEEGQEEVYLLVDGEMTMTVEGEAMSLSAGDAVRVAPEPQ